MEQRILTAAARLINQRGWKFTVDELAHSLGISKKTLYVHYPSKQAIVEAVVDAAIADMQAQRETVVSSDAPWPEKIAALIMVYPRQFGEINDFVLHDLRSHYPTVWEKVEQFRRDEAAVTTALLRQAAAAGAIRPLSPAVAARILHGAIGALLDYHFLLAQGMTFTTARKILADIFLHGVQQRA